MASKEQQAAAWAASGRGGIELPAAITPPPGRPTHPPTHLKSRLQQVGEAEAGGRKAPHERRSGRQALPGVGGQAEGQEEEQHEGGGHLRRPEEGARQGEAGGGGAFSEC